MTSKQEKLAAARKRLKEFQGKSKEIEIPKQKVVSDVSMSKLTRENFSSNDSAVINPHHTSNDYSRNYLPSIQPHQVMQHSYEETAGEKDSQKNASASLTKEGNFTNLFGPGCNNMNEKLLSAYGNKTHEKEKCENSVCDCANGARMESVESVTEKNSQISNCSYNTPIEKNLMRGRDQGGFEKSFHQDDNTNMTWTEPKKFFDNDASNLNPLNETIISLQKKLESHAQTIAILVQQRNDAQIALSKSQSLLNKKEGEAEKLNQQIANLTSSVSNLTHRLFEAETVIKKLNLEKEDNLNKWNESRSLTNNFQAQLDKKEEEFQEMKRKYEEKSKECQQLLMSLQEAQTQLSFYQIQLQQEFQHPSEGHSGPSVKVSELQSEQVNLKRKVEELERKLEAEKAEKEESSQKFHVYAQQCNSQLSSLNSQLKSLKLEKENLSKENLILSKNLTELESAKEKTSSKSYETEMIELLDQVNALSEENKRLKNDLKIKEDERARLENKLEEKEFELNKLLGDLNDLSEENKKLASEVEIPKANERLLAAMESDKIAAAKAVSQNQSLKKQVIELEQAFIKVSEEKLKLTNQLAHEKHVNAELEKMLRSGKGDHQDDQECHDGAKVEPLVNDSNEIEELRSIVRQLQDDKMELTARLDAYESKKRSDVKEKDKKKEEEDSSENGTQCENTNLLLQQMKEKVKKTMNEIAILDEEKEKLEHLVLQLQGETETIGEYITLYQKQRMLLRQRAQEKDSQLLQLSRDKEELKSKLAALDELVQRLLAERENVSFSPGSKLPDVNSSVQIRENTARKIRALINEIGSTTLINNQSIAFEHCSCCSGRLITI